MDQFKLQTDSATFDAKRESSGAWKVDYVIKAKGVKGTFTTPTNWADTALFQYISQSLMPEQ